MGVNKINKCNINSSVATLIDNRKWGVSTDGNTIRSILENYAVFLDCPTSDLDICYPDTCTSVVERVTCSIVISGVSAVLSVPIVTFKVQFTNPYPVSNTLAWTYDTSIFDLVSNDGKGTLVLKAKTGVDLSSTSTGISLSIVDANGCAANTTCCLVSGVLACSCTPCNNVRDLVITSNTDDG